MKSSLLVRLSYFKTPTPIDFVFEYLKLLDEIKKTTL